MWANLSKRTLYVAAATLGVATTTHGVFCHSYSPSKDTASKASTERTNSNTKIVFLGTGSSAGSPRLRCMFTNTEDDPHCKVAHRDMALAAHDNKNYRDNVSLLIHTPTNQFVLIDAGKTFREGVIRWFPRIGVSSLDAILLTHDHADAILGLDDVRGLQQTNESTPVFLSESTMQGVHERFPYLAPGFTTEVQRHVAALDWTVFQPLQPFSTCGLNFTPLPVEHGSDYISYGFSFGERSRVVYISDVSRVLPETERFILSRTPDVLVVDALFFGRKHSTHFSIEDALDFAKQVRAKRTFLVGMAGSIDHEPTNKKLAEWGKEHGLDVQLAHDGLVVELEL